MSEIELKDVITKARMNAEAKHKAFVGVCEIFEYGSPTYFSARAESLKAQEAYRLLLIVNSR